MVNQTYDSKCRRIEILKRLLENEHLSYKRLSEDYLVSRSSIANDILWMKRFLTKEGCHLAFDNSGTFLNLNEVKAQQLLKRLVLERMEKGKSTDFLLNPSLFDRVKFAFDQTLQDLQLDMPDNYGHYMVVAVAIMLERSQAQFELEMTTQVLEDMGEYPLVAQFIQTFQSYLKIDFAANQIAYVTNLLLSSGIRFYIDGRVIPFEFQERVQSLIEQVSQGLGFDLTGDEQLYGHLLVHLYQLSLRLQADTMVINPLASYIKQEYPKVYGVTWVALTDFFQGASRKVIEDEVGFVSLHIEAAIENQKKAKRMILVCPNGVGTSSYLAAKLARALPGLEQIQVVAKNQLDQQDWPNIGLVVTTTPLVLEQVPVIQVSPILNKVDLKRIMSHYIDFVMSDEEVTDDYLSPVLKAYLSQSIYFENLQSKQEVFDFLWSHLDFENKAAKEAFCQSVAQRELLQPTFLDNGFAMPHWNPDLVEKSQVQVLVLDKPLQWNKQTVDVIVLLAITKEDLSHLEQIMSFLVQGVENKEWFMTKLMEVKE